MQAMHYRGMKNLAFCFFIFAASCTHNPHRSAATASPLLDDYEIARIQELYRVWNIAGHKAWPGFSNSNFNLRFILISKTEQWAINVDPLPLYYSKVEVPSPLQGFVNSLAVTEPYRNEFGEKESSFPVEMHRSLPPEFTNFQFNHSIYYVTSIDGFQTEGQTISADEWIHISIHELFHNYQDQFVNYSPKFSKEITFPYGETLKKDQKHNSYLISELKFLAQAACSADRKQILQSLKRSLRIRKQRWNYVETKFGFSIKTWERYQTWAEGSARYVEHEVMSMWPMYANNSVLKSDPTFKNYEGYKAESLNSWCREIAAYSHSYWYDLGFAYALILNKLDPTWKAKQPDQSLFFDGYFRSFDLDVLR